MRLIIVEKPSCAHLLAAPAQAAWPDDELVFLSAITITLTSPKIPRGLPYSSYPIIAESSFKPNGDRLSGGAFCTSYRVNGGIVEKPSGLSVQQTSDLINRADQIMCMPDFDYRGAWGLNQLLEMLSPDLCKEEFDVIRLVGGYTEDQCQFAVNNPIKSSSTEYQVLINAGRVKSYFDYNFTINSLPILGNLYRSIFNTTDPVFISKYALQAIIYLSENDGESEGAIHSRFCSTKWEGSGRYQRSDLTYLDGIGSPASRHEIQKQLIAHGLIYQTGRNLYLTQPGRDFVSQLHKDSKDFDLPFRLNHWMKMPFDQAKLKMDSYLKSFFGKQKRFQKV